MTFEERSEGGEGQAMQASPEGRLSHPGDSKCKSPQAEAGLAIRVSIEVSVAGVEWVKGTEDGRTGRSQ